jgi:hypothetical protein
MINEISQDDLEDTQIVCRKILTVCAESGEDYGTLAILAALTSTIKMVCLHCDISSEQFEYKMQKSIAHYEILWRKKHEE